MLRRLKSHFQRTDSDFKAFLRAHLYVGGTDAQIDSVADEYSEDPAAVGRLPTIPGPSPDRVLPGLSIWYWKPERFNVG